MNAQRQEYSFQDKINIKNNAGVYQIINLLNNKTYIGSSSSLRNRLRYHYNHLQANTHQNKHLQAAWNKYGSKNFVYRILEVCEPIRDTILSLEQKYLDLKPEYNNSPTAGSNLGCKQSEEARRRKSEKHKGVIKISNIKWNGYAPFKGKKIINENRVNKAKPVLQYDLNGNFIAEYNSISTAARILNVIPSGIGDCCNGKQITAYGFIWKFKLNNHECSKAN